MGLNLRPVGYRPKIRTRKPKEVWEQAPNLLILRVTNPQILAQPLELSPEGTQDGQTD